MDEPRVTNTGIDPDDNLMTELVAFFAKACPDGSKFDKWRGGLTPEQKDSADILMAAAAAVVCAAHEARADQVIVSTVLLFAEAMWREGYLCAKEE